MRDAVRAGKVGGYKMQVASYVMASISHLSGGNLDLASIWDNQRPQQAVVRIIQNLIPLVWSQFAQGSGGVRDIRDYFKKEKSWTGLIAASLRNDVNAFPTTLINNEAARGNAQEVVEMAQAVNPNTWFRLAAWFDAQNERERRTIARRFGARGVRNNEAVDAMDLLNRAVENDFIADRTNNDVPINAVNVNNGGNQNRIISVTFPDGTCIANDDPFDTVIDVIDKLGVADVERTLRRRDLNWDDGRHIISARGGDAGYCPIDVNRWLLMPGRTTDKVRLLQIISVFMRADLTIDLIERN